MDNKFYINADIILRLSIFFAGRTAILAGVVCIFSSCGPQQASVPQIYGGLTVAIGAYPAVVALVDVDPEGTTRLKCSGVLVSSQHVLTAGHCLKGEDLRRLYVYLGARVQDREGGRPFNFTGSQLHTVARVSIHPNLRASPNGQADFGIVTLSKKVMRVAPALFPKTLADEYQALQSTQEDRLSLVGFGEREDQSTGEKIEALTHASSFTGAEALVGGDGRDSCRGDSGGPVFITSKDGQKLATPLLLGIISRGLHPSCGTGGIIGLVADQRCWISDVTGLDFDCLRPPHASDHAHRAISFANACKHPASLSLSQHATLDALFWRFQTTSCDELESILSQSRNLNLDFLRLTDLSLLSSFTGLQELSLVGNHLHQLTGLLNLPHLQRLRLRGNDVSDADINTLQGLRPRLRILGRHLQISSYTKTRFLAQCQQAHASSDSQDPLTTAILFVMQTEDCDEANRRLLASKSLSLSGFGIKSLTILAGLDSLESLDLSDNPLTDLSPLASLEALQRLDLASTPLTLSEARVSLAPLLSEGLEITGL